ncbi:hypothetical protein GCM10027566_02720 [Arachidicoccus ginsenosidivorans]|uniref:Uncharacterized protein n=1 Tax=Arachidicoccus ginsenosidivorans TaxID=496057 RepID=A0A5B8VQ94_9BACT|nr:hypothetical protein [Arachidicoccus ginsenosidivorans]QEC72438.1 hypothetical protein FSB73_12885 [Arachidicoccus ginsenosidivorans]
MFKKLNPFKLILLWLIILFIIGALVIPILFATTVGGEQKPLTFFVTLLLAAKYGVLIITIITPFFYFNWIKKYWYISLIAFIISGYYVFKHQQGKSKIKYGFDQEIEYVGKDEIKHIKEYYSFNPKKIRSEKHWINGRKDSIWTVYTKEGSIQSQVEYKNGSLIKTIK